MAYMSKEGYEKLRADIKKLEEIDRPEVIRQIQEAREKGDLSENAEYDAAKEAQGKHYLCFKRGSSYSTCDGSPLLP